MRRCETSSSDPGDDLLPEYDFRQLRVVARGPGWEPFWEKAGRIRESLAGRALADSADLIREDRDR